MAEVWNKRLGPSYYHFTYRNVLFLCLNTEDTCANCISDEQIEYFHKVLEANGKVRWTLVFMHKPAWRGGASDPVWKSWRKIESLLADRPYTVFAGHTHRYDKATHEGRRYYVLAVTGGSFGGKESDKCRFDHVVWVTMTADGPVMANLVLEGILAEDCCP